MDSKQLVKVIKTIVEAEVAKKHSQFLTKTFPKILEEEVSIRLSAIQNPISEDKNSIIDNDVSVDPFEQADLVLQKERTEPMKQLSKNPVLNEVLNKTKPFSAEQRKGTPSQKSVLDKFQPMNESMDTTVTFTNQSAPGGVGAMRAQMASQMGYGDVKQRPNKTGLGVKTGLPGLDRILNRDNSELVKKFRKK